MKTIVVLIGLYSGGGYQEEFRFTTLDACRAVEAQLNAHVAKLSNERALKGDAQKFICIDKVVSDNP